MNINEKEYRSAIYSLNSYLITYDGKQKEPIKIFNDWEKASGFIFTDKDTLSAVLESLEMMAKCPLDNLISAATSDFIPDFVDYLKYDAPPLF